MSLIPWLNDSFSHPRHHMSTWRNPEDYLTRSLLRYPLEEIRNLSSLLQDTGVSLSADKDKFQANIDVAHFKPEEIIVKVTGDNTVTVEGKHEEKEDEHGYISRHFVRKYVLPEDCHIKQVQSKLSSDGVLTITAPKLNDDNAIEFREIPIARTGQPMRRVEQHLGPKSLN